MAKKGTIKSVRRMAALEIAAMIRWKSNNIVKVIHIVSDDDEMSDTDGDIATSTVASETATTATSGINHGINDVTVNDLTKQQSQPSNDKNNNNALNIAMTGMISQTHSTTNDNDVEYDYDGEYDYSDSEEDYNVTNGPQLRILRPPVHEIEERKRKMEIEIEMDTEKEKEQEKEKELEKQPRLSPPNTPPKNNDNIQEETKEEQKGEQKSNIEDMTIQQMLENLDDLEGDQLDHILGRLLGNKNDDQGNHIKSSNKNSNSIKTVSNESNGSPNYYDYDDTEDEEELNYVSHPNPKQFTTHPLTKAPDADLHIFAKSMGYEPGNHLGSNDNNQNDYGSYFSSQSITVILIFTTTIKWFIECTQSK